MSEMVVNRTLSHVPAPQVRDRAEALARDLSSEINLTWKWQSDNVIAFESSGGVAKGLKGTLTIAGQSVCLRLQLTFLLQAMSGKLQKLIDDRLTAADHP